MPTYQEALNAMKDRDEFHWKNFNPVVRRAVLVFGAISGVAGFLLGLCIARFVLWGAI